MPDLVPQAVLAPLTPAAIFLVATIDDGGEQTVHDALGDISGLVRAIGFRDPTKNLSAVTSIGSDAWDRLFAGPVQYRALSILPLADDTVVLPGHGPATTIGRERASNPYLRELIDAPTRGL